MFDRLRRRAPRHCGADGIWSQARFYCGMWDLLVELFTPLPHPFKLARVAWRPTSSKSCGGGREGGAFPLVRGYLV